MHKRGREKAENEKRGNVKEKRGQGKSITFNLSGISDNAGGS